VQDANASGVLDLDIPDHQGDLKNLTKCKKELHSERRKLNKEAICKAQTTRVV
jgi:hypothetical protein